MPKFPIVDSHVHLYDVARFHYAWLADVPKINRTHRLEDFDQARGAVAVDKIVFAEVAVGFATTAARYPDEQLQAYIAIQAEFNRTALDLTRSITGRPAGAR